MPVSAILEISSAQANSPSLARVFEEAGWLGRDAILMAGINSIIYVLSTLPPSVLFPSIIYTTDVLF